MNRFRQFLRGTEGETACLFWLDVQILCQQLQTHKTDERDVGAFINRIQSYYVSDGAPFAINREIRSRLTAAFCCLSPAVSTNYSGLASSSRKGYVRALSEAQTHVITSLVGYWCKAYGSTVGRSVLPDTHIMREEREEATQCSHGLTDTTTRLAEVRSLSTLPETKPLFTPSTTELFPCSNQPIKRSSQLNSHEYLTVYPYLSASLRADSLAGHPFLAFLSLSPLHNSSVSYLLFWQSAELLFTLDEVRRWQGAGKRGQQQTIWDAPNESCPTAKNPTELVELFLIEGSPHKIELPRHTQDKLASLLPRGLGQSLLLSVQEFAAQVSEHQHTQLHGYVHVSSIQQLIPLWREFLHHENRHFISHCVSK